MRIKIAVGKSTHRDAVEDVKFLCLEMELKFLYFHIIVILTIKFVFNLD